MAGRSHPARLAGASRPASQRASQPSSWPAPRAIGPCAPAQRMAWTLVVSAGSCWSKCHPAGGVMETFWERKDVETYRYVC